MEINEKLKALREDNDLKQKDIAEITGVTIKQVWRWEQNQSEMGITKLLAICKYFNVSADYILGLPRGLSWPREEDRRKTYNSTKYLFFLCRRAHSDLRTMGVDLMRPLSLQTATIEVLPKIVIETRKEDRLRRTSLFVSKVTYSCS